MESKAIFLPLCAQVIVTLLVWIWMYITRIGTLWRSGVDTQELADESRSQEILKAVVNPSDNFENLFELPVLFYVAILVIFSAHLADDFYLKAAWAFVALRAIHSFIHCTYNRIIHRFTAYALGAVVLWVIWIRIVGQLTNLLN